MMTRIISFLGLVGKRTHSVLIETAHVWQLVCDFCYWAFAAPLAGKRGLQRESFAKQMFFMGNESIPIVTMVSASVGAVLALQAAYQLKQFGAILYTGSLVAVSITRELGPIVTAIVIAGRVGAAITAELGTMKVSEEVDALITMGIPPIPFLVVPRLVALCIMLPCLTVLSYAVGMLGGYLIGTLSLGINPDMYVQATFDSLVPKDMLTGLAKSFVFAILVGFISTYTGLHVEGGADGVGRATTQSVVASIFSIIIADGICTAVFYYAFP